MSKLYKNRNGIVVEIDTKTRKESLFGKFHKGNKKEDAKNFTKNLNILSKMKLTEEGKKGRDDSRKFMQHQGEFNMDRATNKKYDI